MQQTYSPALVARVQQTINIWFAHRRIPVSPLVVDGVKGPLTDDAIRTLKRCLGWQGRNINRTIGPKFRRALGLQQPPYRLNPAQRVRGLAVRRKLQRAYAVPAAVQAAYARAQAISAHRWPYVWGGGHDPAFTGPYDCSGGASAVLHAAGLLAQPETTTGLQHWGAAGVGEYMTLWVHETADPAESHAFLVFTLPGHEPEHWGTGDWGSGFTGWGRKPLMHPTAGFSPRHAP